MLSFRRKEKQRREMTTHGLKHRSGSEPWPAVLGEKQQTMLHAAMCMRLFQHVFACMFTCRLTRQPGNYQRYMWYTHILQNKQTKPFLVISSELTETKI